jgi:hypothetical protein
MLTKIAFTSSVLAALAAAAPKPDVAGYSNAAASFTVSEPTGIIATVFGPDSQVPVSCTALNLVERVLTFTRLVLPCLVQLLHE